MPSEPRTLVLHGLRLKGFAEALPVAETVDVDESEAKLLLDQLVSEGLASYRDGRMSGFTLTPSGRIEHARLLSEELEASGAAEPVRAQYARFLGLNGGLLEVCTAWQLREGEGGPVMNDHTDEAYDAGVVEQLVELHSRVRPICEELGELLARYGRYGPRLSAAVDHVRAGDTDWFTKPMIPSYHTIWFELHEDLLATLGIERGAEVTT